MNHNLYSVLDTKAEAFLPIFTAPNDAMATRSFKDAVDSESHQFGKHPEDYVLHIVGKFDDSSAEVVPCTPKVLVTGLTVQTTEGS